MSKAFNNKNPLIRTEISQDKLVLTFSTNPYAMAVKYILWEVVAPFFCEDATKTHSQIIIELAPWFSREVERETGVEL